jgi:hypothetical protein
MNLYAIRIENDETIVITAASAEEALKGAGLPACLLLAPEQPGQGHGVPSRRQYAVIELSHVRLHLHSNSGGNLDVFDADQRTLESLFQQRSTCQTDDHRQPNCRRGRGRAK